MSEDSKRISPLRRLAGFLALGVLISAAAAIAVAGATLYWKERPVPSRFGPPPPDTRGMMTNTPFMWPGIKQPPTRSAAESRLPDEAEVIGVTVGDKHRAYLLSAFRSQTQHIVNDLIGRVPATVTYCDQTNCAKVFTSDDLDSPLDINLCGMGDDEMLLQVGKIAYGQKSGQPIHIVAEPFPYKELKVERVRWKAWKDAHSDSDVYEGPESGVVNEAH
jgi:hypothetical protein